jgi:hypothetical protein
LFRIISPRLVLLIWSGATFSLGGGLLAVRPAAAAARRRATAGLKARVAQDLGRA